MMHIGSVDIGQKTKSKYESNNQTMRSVSSQHHRDRFNYLQKVIETEAKESKVSGVKLKNNILLKDEQVVSKRKRLQEQILKLKDTAGILQQQLLKQRSKSVQGMTVPKK